MSEAALPVEMPFAGGLRLFSDERLVKRAATGDQRAFAAIYRRYNEELHRFTLAIVGDAEDASDVLQATMVKAMRALPGERREIQLKPWLYRIAHNESMELLRRRRSAVQLSTELPTVAPQPDEEVEQRSRLRVLFRDLEDLPERQRGALLLRELSGLGFDEIAAALRVSPAVARQTVYEARLSLRQMEEGRDLDCASVTRALSEEDGRVSRRRDLRAHLRNCPGCRGFKAEIGRRRADLAAIGPLPSVAAAGILKGALGAEGVGGLGGSLAGGIGASVAAKSVATVAVVATLGAAVADRSGSIDLGLPGGNSAAEAPAPAGGHEAPGWPSAPIPNSGRAEALSTKGVETTPSPHGGGRAPSPAVGHGGTGSATPHLDGLPAAGAGHGATGDAPSEAPPAAQFGQETAAGGGGGGNPPAQGGGSSGSTQSPPGPPPQAPADSSGGTGSGGPPAPVATGPPGGGQQPGAQGPPASPPAPAASGSAPSQAGSPSPGRGTGPPGQGRPPGMP